MKKKLKERGAVQIEKKGNAVFGRFSADDTAALVAAYLLATKGKPINRMIYHRPDFDMFVEALNDVPEVKQAVIEIMKK